MKNRSGILIGVVAMLLSACGEQPQTITAKPGQSAAKLDDKPFGAGTQYADRASWERQLRARADNQNEYKRVN
jgi:starvation-inducible outer membrane lipoprotein